MLESKLLVDWVTFLYLKNQKQHLALSAFAQILLDIAEDKTYALYLNTFREIIGLSAYITLLL
jgi:hypothetical protein